MRFILFPFPIWLLIHSIVVNQRYPIIWSLISQQASGSAFYLQVNAESGTLKKLENDAINLLMLFLMK